MKQSSVQMSQLSQCRARITACSSDKASWTACLSIIVLEHFFGGPCHQVELFLGNISREGEDFLIHWYYPILFREINISFKIRQGLSQQGVRVPFWHPGP